MQKTLNTTKCLCLAAALLILTFSVKPVASYAADDPDCADEGHSCHAVVGPTVYHLERKG